MKNFNPFMSSPTQNRNQTYADPYRNFTSQSQQRYSPVDASTYAPEDAWMSPSFPSNQLVSDPYSSSPSQCSGAPNPNRLNCTLQHVARTGGGIIAGGYGGAKFGLKKCKKNRYYPVCVGGSVASGAAAGGFEGFASARDSASCQDLVVRGPSGTCYGTDHNHEFHQ